MSDASAGLEVGLSNVDQGKRVQQKTPHPTRGISSPNTVPELHAQEQYERSLIRSYQDLILRRVNNEPEVQSARTTGDDAAYTSEWYRVYDQTSHELWQRFVRLYPGIAARYAEEYPVLAKSLQAAEKKETRRGFLRSALTEAVALTAGSTAAVAAGTAKGRETVTQFVEDKFHADPSIAFEPMVHVSGEQDLFDAIAKGNLDYHFDDLSKETTERLRKNNSSVLAIDSLYVDPSKEVGSTYLSLDQQKLIWGMSPGRPEVLQPQTKTVYLVAGDLNWYTLSADYVRFQSQAIGDYSESLKKQEGKLIEHHNILEARATGKTEKEWQEAVGVATLLGVVTQQAAGVWLESKEHRPEHTTDRQKLEKLLGRVVDRRSVLRGLSGLGLGIIAGKIGKQYIDNAVYDVPYTKTALGRDFYQAITDAIGENMESDVWADGRTAMVIAKEQAAMAYLKEHGEIADTAKGAVVMGNGHDFQGVRLLGDKRARTEAIYEYAKSISELTQQVLQKEGLPENFINFALDNVLDYFSLTGVMKVTDPGKTEDQSVDEYIGANVQCLTTMRSPEIDAIVQPLRPHE